MTHQPFLKTIAKHYSEINDIKDYCFVFPNRRSIQFFNYYLSEVMGKEYMAPTTVTITDFIADFTDDILATPIELIFTLYQAYREITNNDSYEFDKFVYWSKIIIDDFNDVDLYMVNAKAVFKNTAELKEIATDYISDELKKELERYFNVKFDYSNDDDSFWKNLNSRSSNSEEDTEQDIKNKYLTLWQLLYPLYEKYNEMLEKKGLTYTGKISRIAAEKIKSLGAEELQHKKYVFVGFNVLSTSELAIFEALKKKNIAEFCWDNASPAFNQDDNNKGAKFLNINLNAFKNAVELEHIEKFPENINVIAVPSRIGMAKYAFNIVEDLADNGTINDINSAIDTAIVLPDEQLFPYLLNSISEKAKNVNATLGYPLQKSDIASLMALVSKMHKNANRSGNQSEYTFFKDFVKEVLTHPLLVSIYGIECSKKMNEIEHKNIFNVPESMFKGSNFEPLFITIKDLNNGDEIIAYIDRIIAFCENLEKLHTNNNAPSDDNSIPLQSAFIQQYIEVLEEIKLIIKEYGVPMCESTIFYLITKLTNAYTIPFQGEPLKYLQMMGMLETRNMDFKNLILLSMNERVFPRKFYKKSFIPTKLRRGFMMSTTDQQEAMTAYYFYRLLARSENVYLLYDTSSNGIGSNEYSRFISQLKRIYRCELKFAFLSTDIKPTKSIHFELKKDEQTQNKIKQYFTKESEKYLSASSIKEYVKCPLLFYFHHIEKLDKENEPSEFIDAATFGTIVHDSLQELYYPEINEEWKHHKVTKSMILDFKNKKLKKCLLENLYKTYLHREYDPNETPTAETNINISSLTLYVENVLNYDLSLLEKDDDFIEVYECEKTYKTFLKVSDKLSFNFTFKADRIDKINGTGNLRIIDYKTGADETASTQEKLFLPPHPKNVHAILQLMLYCMAYAQEHPEEKDPIQPIIYKILDMSKPGVTIDKTLITDYKNNTDQKGRNILEVFKENLEKCISSLNDPEQPFIQCEEKNNKSCSYCNFAAFCRR